MADSVGSGFPSTGIQKGHTFFDLDEQSLWMYIGGIPRLVSSWKLLSGVFSSDPDTSLWGMSQAGAQWFNSSLGQMRTWIGSQIISVSDPPLNLNTFVFEDDFLLGVASGATGDLLGAGWVSTNTLSGNLTFFNNSELGHPGIVTLTTGVISSSTVLLRANSLAVGNGSIASNEIYEYVAIARLNSSASTFTARIGLASQFGSTGAYFEKLGADTNWFVVSGNGGPTRIDTGVVAVNGTWLKFKIQTLIVGGNLLFSINDGSIIEKSTDLPVTPFVPQIFIQNPSGSTKFFQVDYVGLRVTNLQRF
jgi:hypothetical protein